MLFAFEKIIMSQLISFVLPIYNEEANIPRLWEELSNLEIKVIEKFGPDTYNFEYIFVADGCKDKSVELLQNIHNQFPDKIKIRVFGRNFGHQIAVSAGQDIAAGDAVIIMDTDLQDPPLACLDLIDKWREGFEIVYAQRRVYKVPLSKKIPAWLFYRLMSKIANVSIPEDTGDFRLISRAVNDEMKKFPEKNRYLRGISFLTGFSTAAVLFDRSDRYSGKPGYTFTKSLKLAFDGIAAFSLFPIRLVSITGSVFAIFSFVFGIIYILVALFSNHQVAGWASLMFTIIFLGGIQLIMLGILGEYIGRIYTQVLNRPLYTVVKEYGTSSKSI